MGAGKLKGVLWLKIREDIGFTYEEQNAKLKAMYKKYDWSFLIAGEETCPSTHKEHVDFYYEMPTQRKITTERTKFRKVFGPGYYSLELARGGAGENADYSSKDGCYFKLGEPVKNGSHNSLNEAVALINKGELTPEQIAIANPMQYHMYGRTLRDVEDIYLRTKFRTEHPVAIWMWGPTSKGKSHRAFDGYDPSTHYLWKINDKGWQDGYRQQPVVVINDLRHEIKFNEMTTMVDKWPHFVPRRGREPMPFTSGKIIVTSSMSPLEVYRSHYGDDDDSVDQVIRRFEIIEITARSEPNITSDHLDAE